MRAAALFVAALLPLAACNREPDVDLKNASVEEVANEVRASGAAQDFIRPGKWQTKVVVEDVDIPGMPAATKAQMKDMFAQRQNVTVDHCVTPEEAKKPDGSLFNGKDNGNCRYEHFTMSGGKIDAVMRCTGEGQGRMTMKMTGTYTPESSSTRSEMQIASGGNQGSMTIKARSETRRVGACDGKEG